MILKVLIYFSVWDLARWIRFAAALFMFAGAATEWHILPLIVGSVFLYQAFTNTGCCNGGSCEIPHQNKTIITKDKN